MDGWMVAAAGWAVCAPSFVMMFVHLEPFQDVLLPSLSLSPSLPPRSIPPFESNLPFDLVAHPQTHPQTKIGQFEGTGGRRAGQACRPQTGGPDTPRSKGKGEKTNINAVTDKASNPV